MVLNDIQHDLPPPLIDLGLDIAGDVPPDDGGGGGDDDGGRGDGGGGGGDGGGGDGGGGGGDDDGDHPGVGECNKSR